MRKEKMKKVNKITFLVDNQALPHLKSEHGLAILIEHDGLRILFDNGSGDALFDNARYLKQKLDNLDVIILSHGHYDHTENTAWLLQNNPKTKIYLHPDALQTRYSKHIDKPLKCISMKTANRQAIERFPQAQVYYHTGIIKISEQLVLSGQIPRKSAEDVGGPFYLDTQCQTLDSLLDDQCLWLKKDKEVHIIAGCCHSGLINTIKYTAHHNPHHIITSITGGLHLSNASPERIQASIKVLKKAQLTSLYPAHCTGQAVSTQLKKALYPKTDVVLAKAGLSFCL